MSKRYTIESKAGVVYGTYPGESPGEALAAMAADGGGAGEALGALGDWIIYPATVEEKGADHPKDGVSATRSDGGAAEDDPVTVTAAQILALLREGCTWTHEDPAASHEDAGRVCDCDGRSSDSCERGREAAAAMKAVADCLEAGDFEAASSLESDWGDDPATYQYMEALTEEIETPGDWRYFLRVELDGWWINCRAPGGESDHGPYATRDAAISAAHQLASVERIDASGGAAEDDPDLLESILQYPRAG